MVVSVGGTKLFFSAKVCAQQPFAAVEVGMGAPVFFNPWFCCKMFHMGDHMCC